jgi:hypothetical protein
MIRTASAAFALLLLASLVGGPTQAAPGIDIVGTLGSPPSNCGTYTEADSSSATIMVGDSITQRGTDELAELRPRWEIDGLAGRNVDCLRQFIADRLAEGYVHRVVIALGTNAMEGWGPADYQAVVDMIPARAVVVFVNTYRDPAVWPNSGPFRLRAGSQWAYSLGMAGIAAGPRPGVCVANWRAWAMNHPDELSDGVHPDAVGQAAWARIVDEAADSC